MSTLYVDDLQLATGVDIPISELKLVIRQPSVAEIARMTEERYFQALSLFRVNEELLEKPPEEKKEITNWGLFNELLAQKIEGIEDVKGMFLNFLRLFVPKLNFGPRSLIIDTGSEIVNIEQENFDIFQKAICEVGAEFLLGKHKNEDFNPANETARAIANKIIEGRKRVAAQKTGSNDKGFLAQYIKAAATMTPNSLEDVKKMTIYQLNEIVQMYLAWEGYELDVKVRLAGGKGDKKIVHWMMRKNQNETTVGTL